MARSALKGQSKEESQNPATPNNVTQAPLGRHFETKTVQKYSTQDTECTGQLRCQSKWVRESIAVPKAGSGLKIKLNRKMSHQKKQSRQLSLKHFKQLSQSLKPGLKSCSSNPVQLKQKINFSYSLNAYSFYYDLILTADWLKLSLRAKR